MTDPRKLVDAARDEAPSFGGILQNGLDYTGDLLMRLADALTAALNREADGEAGWSAAELGEPRDDAKSVQWLDGWEYYTALDRAELAEARLLRRGDEENFLGHGSKP